MDLFELTWIGNINYGFQDNCSFNIVFYSASSGGSILNSTTSFIGNKPYNLQLYVYGTGPWTIYLKTADWISFSFTSTSVAAGFTYNPAWQSTRSSTAPSGSPTYDLFNRNYNVINLQGNVGIGKSPTCALDVSGSVNVSGYIKSVPVWFNATNGATDGTVNWANYTGFVPWLTIDTGSVGFTTNGTSTGGYFTAPVNGFYQFNAQVLNYPNTTSYYCSISYFVNNVEMAFTRYGSVLAQTHLACSALLKLNVNDVVKVRVYNVYLYTIAGHAIFSGVLINTF